MTKTIFTAATLLAIGAPVAAQSARFEAVAQQVQTQSEKCIWLQVEFEDDKGRATSNIKTKEGTFVAGLSMKHGEGSRAFGLDAMIRDLSSGVVHIVIHDRLGRRIGEVLDEFDLQAGRSTIQSSTVPSFGLALVEIYDLNEFYGPNCGPSRPEPLR